MAKSASLLIIFLVVFVDLVGFGIVIPILPYYAQSFGASGETLGWLMTSYSATQFLFAPFWGRLSDRVGRKPVLIGTIIGSSLALAFTASATTLEQLFIGRLLAGLFGANISTASAYMADITDESNRTKGMGLIGAAFGIGFIFGPAIGGSLSRWGYDVPLYFAAALSTINAFFALWKLKEPYANPIEREQSRHHRRFSRESIRIAFGDRRSRLAIAVFFLVTVGITQMEVTFALYMKAVHGLNAEQAGWYLAFMGISMAIVQGGLVGKLSKKFGEYRLILAGTIIMSLALMWFASISELGVFIFLSLGLLAVGSGLTNPSLSSLASKGAEPQRLGMTMGVYQSAGSFARIVGPPVAGILFDRAALAAPFYAASGIMFAACVGVFYIQGWPKRTSIEP